MKSWIRPTVTIVLGLITVVVLFHVIENWRGARIYEATMEALQEAGEPLDPGQYRTSKVLPSAATTELLQPSANPDPFARFRDAGRALSPSTAGWDRAFFEANQKLGLTEGAASPVVRYLAGTEELSSEAREYIEGLPGSVDGWGIDFSDGFSTTFPHLDRVMGLASLLQARGIAYALEGNSEAAFENLQGIFRTAGAFSGEGTLIETLVGFSLIQQALLLLNVGIQQETWSVNMLAEIETTLGKVRPLQRMIDGLRGERLLFLEATEGATLRDLVMMIRMSDGQSGNADSWLMTLYDLRPAGWTASDRAVYASTIQEWIDDLELAPERGIDLGRFAALPKSAFQTFQHPLSSVALPSLDGSLRRALRVENDVRLAEVSCAIERFRIENGRLPESAAEVASLLTPPALPEDLPHAQPVQYRKTGEGSYLLYGLGLDGTDDGGSPEGRGHLSKDWVWAVEIESVVNQQGSGG